MFEDLIKPKSIKDPLKEFNIDDKHCPYCHSTQLYKIDGVFLNKKYYKISFVCKDCKRSWKVIIDTHLNIIDIECNI